MAKSKKNRARKSVAAAPAKSPTTSPAAPPKPVTQSEVVDRRMAAVAMQKSAAGETPSAQEVAALRRVERAQEETMRWQYYRTIPQSHWARMSDRQPKILQEQSERYGLPFGAAVIDLPALAKKLHDFLAQNATAFSRHIPMPEGTMPMEAGKALADGTNALEVTRAAMTLASRRLHSASAQGMAHASLFEELKNSLKELRQAEADYITLAEQRGTLVPRETLKMLAGTQASRLVQCVVNLENAIATEFEVWLADPAMAGMAADQRRRKVREFVAATCNEVRRQEADGAEKMIQEITRDMENGDE